MKAPERLYLSELIQSTFQYQVPDPDDKTAVEYTRTDLLIEEVCKWLKDNASNYVIEHLFSCEVDFEEDKMIEDLENYMKGE